MKRRRDPAFLETPEFVRWSLDAEAALRVALTNKGGPWTPDVWQCFKKHFLLKDADSGRCAYCEGKYWAGTTGDAEHHRPKAAVTEDRELLAAHRGYYWLAYEWQNIILACSFCNTYHTDCKSDVKHPGKLNEFPITGRRVFEPDADRNKWWQELHLEEPLLLHPYWDDPEDHFALGRRAGYIYGSTEKGRVTIDVCDLNRQVLVEERMVHEARVSARLQRFGSRGKDTGWFDESDHYSTYLNCRLDQELQRVTRRYSAPGQPVTSLRSEYRRRMKAIRADEAT